MAAAHALLRVFWPEQLSSELASASSPRLLFGWYLPDSGAVGISGCSTVTYVVAGALEAGLPPADVELALGSANTQAQRRSVQQPVALLGTWQADAAGPAALQPIKGGCSVAPGLALGFCGLESLQPASESSGRGAVLSAPRLHTCPQPSTPQTYQVGAALVHWCTGGAGMPPARRPAPLVPLTCAG